jgi:hypothetical protein
MLEEVAVVCRMRGSPLSAGTGGEMRRGSALARESVSFGHGQANEDRGTAIRLSYQVEEHMNRRARN